MFRRPAKACDPDLFRAWKGLAWVGDDSGTGRAELIFFYFWLQRSVLRVPQELLFLVNSPLFMLPLIKAASAGTIGRCAETGPRPSSLICAGEDTLHKSQLEEWLNLLRTQARIGRSSGRDSPSCIIERQTASLLHFVNIESSWNHEGKGRPKLYWDVGGWLIVRCADHS